MHSISLGLSKPFEQESSQNHGAGVVIAALVSLVAMLPFTITRLVLAATLKRDKGGEHILSIASTVRLPVPKRAVSTADKKVGNCHRANLHRY